MPAPLRGHHQPGPPGDAAGGGRSPAPPAGVEPPHLHGAAAHDRVGGRGGRRSPGIRIIPFPVTEPDLWDDYVPAGRRPLLRLFSPWGGAKLDRLRARGYRTEVLEAPEGKTVSGEQVRAAIRDGGDWRPLVPPAVARLHRRPPRRACARSSSCCLTGSGTGPTPPTGGARRTRPPARPAWTPSPRAAPPACCSPLGPGRAPSSEVAHWAILGYPPSEFPGRAVLEAPWPRALPGRRRGARPRGPPDDRAPRRGPLGHRPGRPRRRRGRPDPAGERPAVRGRRARAWSCAPSWRRGARPCSSSRGGAHDGGHRLGSLLPRPPSRSSAPGPSWPRPRATARAAELWSRATLRALARHPANAARRRRGRAPLAAVTLKWWGRPREAPDLPRAPRPRRRPGRRLALPRRPGGDRRACGSPTAPRATTRPPPCATGSRSARSGPRRRRHLRLLPPEGHRRGRPHEGPGRQAPHDRGASTRALGGLGDRFADAVVCVTGDHATPTSPEVIHSGDPVPFLLAGPGVRADRVERFGELDCADGLLGRLDGRGRDARAAERRRPSALPGLAPHAGALGRRRSRPTSSRCGPRRGPAPRRPRRRRGSRRSSRAGSRSCPAGMRRLRATR